MSHRPRRGVAGVEPPRRQRRCQRKWTKPRRRRFLETLAESCNVSAAARAAGMDRSSAYDLKDRDPEFRRGWRAALEQAYADLEWDLLKIAREGDVRTEVTYDPKTGERTKVKLTHERKHAVAVRLLLSHKEEVAAFRVAEAAEKNRADMVDGIDEDKALAWLAEIDARIAAGLARKAP